MIIAGRQRNVKLHLRGDHAAMDRRRNQSDVLPVVHMTNNLALLILVVIQFISGIGIVQGVLLQ